jgi:preprotein translocase subunit SecG
VDILLLVLHVILSLGIITLVLLQKGAGASAGASFGGGSGSVFGATGSANFLSKTTAVFATAFFINSLVLAYLASHREVQVDSVLDKLNTPAVVVPGEKSGEVPVPEVKAPATDEAAPTEEDVPAPEMTTPSASDETAPAEEGVPAPAGE